MYHFRTYFCLHLTHLTIMRQTGMLSSLAQTSNQNNSRPKRFHSPSLARPQHWQQESEHSCHLVSKSAASRKVGSTTAGWLTLVAALSKFRCSAEPPNVDWFQLWFQRSHSLALAPSAVRQWPECWSLMFFPSDVHKMRTNQIMRPGI